MKFREFMNTCQNDLGVINIYFGDVNWDEMIPEFTFNDMGQVDDDYLDKYVDAWYVDANFSLHVLLSY